MLEIVVLTIDECVIAIDMKAHTTHENKEHSIFVTSNACVIIIIIDIFFFFLFFFLSFISDAPDNENRNYEYRREYILINLFRPLIFFIIHLSCTIFELLACDPLFLWWYSQWQYNIIFDRSQTMTTHNKFNQYIYILPRDRFRT